jgi:hypothetical protein
MPETTVYEDEDVWENYRVWRAFHCRVHLVREMIAFQVVMETQIQAGFATNLGHHTASRF